MIRTTHSIRKQISLLYTVGFLFLFLLPFLGNAQNSLNRIAKDVPSAIIQENNSHTIQNSILSELRSNTHDKKETNLPPNQNVLDSQVLEQSVESNSEKKSTSKTRIKNLYSQSGSFTNEDYTQEINTINLKIKSE
ncbi:hypothetical protein M0M57_04155 [Flavobacterium azooxidireducens]|uniref:Uncharacterized protein n=1 Tax=Flavobacterium azooxidireducens TaxID=1871076 RepID=A0ABY4KK48_9FLAO|nr:hypothetical protein [Flavobacterium azooxidireducens]UPQ80033.1 hypothetical protein M0M57_04155 [Flavobacterium azooxidireducens]